MMMMMMICMIDKRTHMSSVAMIFILQNYVQEMREVGFFRISQELQQQQNLCWFSQMQCMVKEF
jgi:hypothetical protein